MATTRKNPVQLDAQLVESLGQVATQQGVALDELLGELVRHYLRQVRRDAIRREYEAYRSLHGELKRTHLGLHLAIYEGRVIDQDANAEALVQRVNQRYGEAPVMMVQVTEELDEILTFRSPRLVSHR